MGAVYLAHDTQLDRQVAIKIPHFDRGDGPEVLERFYRESRAAATLDHPNICPVHDVGEIDGVHYLVMAYIEGKPLSDFVRRDKPIPPRQVATIVRKLALALHEAHSHGVVHRDLKPANIMTNKRRELVIMDFGLARLTNKSSQSESRLTQSGIVMGTPSYMSPEQVMGDRNAMGPPCDIYSMGVIMNELLTGRLP
jgi:serine/threonine protein kinase